MPSQLDEVCKKYGYKGVNVATWRDPSLSVLAGGRGPRAGCYKVAPADVAAPFVPTYKVRYPVPEPEVVDDDGFEGDEMRDQYDDDDIYDKKGDELVDSPLQSAAEDNAEEKLDEAAIDAPEQPWTDDVIEDPPDHWDLDEDIAAAQQNDVDALAETLLAADDAGPSEHNDPASDVPDTTVDAAPVSSTEIIPEVIEDVGGLKGEAPPADEEQSNEKKVAFAPGTPDPKPTQRKKKDGKASKGKKKRGGAPALEDPSEEQEFGNGATSSHPAPPLDPPVISEAETAVGPEEDEVDVANSEAVTVSETSAVDDTGATEALEKAPKDNVDPEVLVDTATDELKDDADVAVVAAAPEVIDGPPSKDLPPTDADPVDAPAGDESGNNIEDVSSPPPPPPPVEEESWEKPSKKKGSKKGSKKKGSKAQPESEQETAVIEEISSPAAPQVDPKEEAGECPPEPAEPVTQEPDPADGLWAPAASKKKKGKKGKKVVDPLSNEQAFAPEDPADASIDPPAAGEVQPELTAPEPPAAVEAEAGAEVEDKPSKKKGKKASKKKEAKVKDFAAAAELSTDAADEPPPVDEEVALEIKKEAVIDGVRGDDGPVGGEEKAGAVVDRDLAADDAASGEPAADAGKDKIGGDEAASPVDSDMVLEDEKQDTAFDHDVGSEDVLHGDAADAVAQADANLLIEEGSDGDAKDDDKAVKGDAEEIVVIDAAAEDAKEELEEGDEKVEDDVSEDKALAEDWSPSEEPAVPADDEQNIREAAEVDVDEVSELGETAVTEDDAAGLDRGREDDDEAHRLDDESLDEAPAADDKPDETKVLDRAVDNEDAADEEPLEATAPSEPAPEVDAVDPAPAEAVPEHTIAPDEQLPNPPSPALTKTTSHGSHKSTHWNRPHQANRLREALQAPVALKRPHGHRTGSRDEVVHRGERKHRRRRDSVTQDRDKDIDRKERKRAEKKRNEAVARVVEEERKKTEDEIARRKRHEARRAERAAAKEEEARAARKDAERDAERRRKRRQEREVREVDRREAELREELREKGKAAKAREMEEDRSSRAGAGGISSSRPPRSSMSSTSSAARPMLAKMFTGESVHRTGFLVSYGPGGGEEDEQRPASRRSKEDSAARSSVSRGSARMLNAERTKTAAPGAVIAGLEGLDESGREGGERRSRRRPTMERGREKPKSFLGSIFKRS